MDHHKGLIFMQQVDGFEEGNIWPQTDRYLYSTLYKYKKNDAGFIRGYHFGAGANGRATGDAAIGESLKEAMTEPGPWRMNLYAFGECLPYADNRITLNTIKKIIGEDQSLLSIVNSKKMKSPCMRNRNYRQGNDGSSRL